jgi:hypothetical protein
MTTNEKHERQADTQNASDRQWGCYRAKCSCGWESGPTNARHHLGRTFKAHHDAEVRAAKKN